MEKFCKGMLWGVLVGTCVGAVIVARNKKLSKKLNQGLEVAEEKIMETKQALEEKMNQDDCNSGACGDASSNNNFSKKNKNC